MANENPITLTAYVEGGIEPRVHSRLAVQYATPAETASIVNRRLGPVRFPPPIDLFMGCRSWTPDVAAWLALDIDPRMVETQPSLQAAAVRGLVRLVEDPIRSRIGDQATPKECVQVIRDLGIEPPWMTSVTPRTNKERRDNTLPNIIGGLLELILCGTDDAGKPLSVFTKQSQIIGHLLDQHPNIPGLSESNLKKVFADANKSLKES